MEHGLARGPRRATQRLALVAPVRTPIGKFGGCLAGLSAADLGTHAAEACLRRAGIAGDASGVVDQTIFGHGRQANGGPNSARQIAFRAGIPDERPAFTINQACGSGLQSVISAARTILLGEAEVILAGGTESMSNTPYLLPRARWGYRLGSDEIVDGMYKDGFNDPLSGLVMGETAEELAVEAGVTREAADLYAVETQRRCEAARGRGRFVAEIEPIRIPGRKGETVIAADEHPRDGVTLESLAKMPAVFRKGGTVTAANASGITDGAAALLVASEAATQRHGLTPAGYLLDWEVVGVAPRIMGIGPVPATRNLLQRNGLGYADIEAVELNEAFASQAVACLAQLPFDPAKVNADGGAIALGHPIGATGARILVTLLAGMAERGQRLGIATLCISGGMGIAILVERNLS
ncbi:MAG: thiolase family protein [Thermoanaerobaculia bacterium]|nr:thiolase family protein [Thermoanaerobaculia bacterium]MBP9823431.1 thiolase family protein [Thermoanaerobaculia bacterium]